jgi:glycosyltransferase involved in cell wall biosynthesis
MDEPSNLEWSKLEKEIALHEAKYQDSLRRNKSLEGELLAAEEALTSLREKLRAANRKRSEADRYRSLLHRLRARWYLRPFIPGRVLSPPAAENEVWKFRGPRFKPSSGGAERPRDRVLIVGHLLSSMLFGSEQSLLDIIHAIDPERFDLFVVFPEENDSVFRQLQSFVQGIAVLDYRWWRVGRPAPEQSVGAFATLLREQAIDLVHVNTIMIRDPLIAARRLRIPSIVHVRELVSLDDELAGRLGGTPSAIVKSVCEITTHILANSATTLSEFDSGDRGTFLYNSIDGESLDLSNLVDAHSIKVGMVSSNIRKKGVLEFLELACLAEKSLPTLQFYLIGPVTPLIEEWKAGIERLPVNFHLRDYVSPPAAAYHDLNIVLNLSRFAESFGRTVAEAMTARRPVVAYGYGALPELIDDGETGFLVPYLDLPAVLDRLRFFAESPAAIAEFGERARQRNLQRFSREALSQGINALYERLIAERGQQSTGEFSAKA